MSSKEKILDEPAEIACRRLAMKLLDVVAQQGDRLGHREDPEALHDFRVSVRRLRTHLRLYRPWLDDRIVRKAGRRFGELMDQTGANRDNEVHVAWLQAQLQRRLSQRRHTGIRLLLDEIETSCKEDLSSLANAEAQVMAGIGEKLRNRLVHGTGADRLEASGKGATFALATADIAQKLSSRLRQRLAHVQSFEDRHLAHDARMIAKRLRYLLDPVRQQVAGGPRVVKQLKDLQDLRGELHDLHILEARAVRATKRVAKDWSAQMMQAVTSDEPLPPMSANAPHLSACYALADVCKMIRRQQQRLFSRLEQRWLLDHGDPFFESTDRIIRQLAPP